MLHFVLLLIGCDILLFGDRVNHKLWELSGDEWGMRAVLLYPPVKNLSNACHACQMCILHTFGDVFGHLGL